MANTKQMIPLQILTGFLGSGKTTLLKAVIDLPSMNGTVLLINEVGEIGIDDKLFTKDHPVVLLDSGCICCTLQDGLINVLHYLIQEKENGNLSVNKVIIETTGIADPAPIIDSIFSYIEFEYNYCFAGTITVIDGINARVELAKNYESVKQIALADKIIISKTDMISQEEQNALVKVASDLNPNAEIYTSNLKNPPADAFTKFDIFNTPKKLSTIMNWINSKRKDYKLASNIEAVKVSGIMTKPVVPHSNYTTISLQFHKPLNRISVVNSFNIICQQFGEAVLRMKGIFDFDEGYPFVLHGVCGVCYPISNLADWEGKNPFSDMVVICNPSIAQQIKYMLKSMIIPIDGTENDITSNNSNSESTFEYKDEIIKEDSNTTKK